MKTCSACKQSKPVEDFSVRSSTMDGRQYYCKECGKKHYKSWKDRSPETKNRYNDWKQKRKVENRQRLLAVLKESPCVDCGYEDVRVLQFDHVRGTKVAGVAELLNRGAKWETILTEIEKCEVRCCNCHTVVTAERGNWWLTAP